MHFIAPHSKSMIQAWVVHMKSPQFGKEMLCQAHHRESRIKSQIYINQGKSLSINFTGRFSLATGAASY
jgi:hypothetical protein